MPAGELILRLASGVLLIAANAFFVVTEFALTRTRQFDEADFQGDPALERAWKMTERLEIHLTGCQLGISSTSVLLGVVFEPAVTAMIEPLLGWTGMGAGTLGTVSVVLSVIVINLVHKIWGEQAPTYLGVERPREVLKRTAVPMYWWTRIAYPIIAFGDGLAKASLRLFGVEITRSWTEAAEDETPGPQAGLRERLAGLLRDSGVPRDRQREVVKALEIGEMETREIMVPRERMVVLSSACPFEENVARMRRSGKVRYPLVRGDGDGDAVEGVVYLPDVVSRYDALRDGEAALADLAHPRLDVAPEVSVAELIDRLQDARSELATITEGGRLVGLVTLTDALEAIVGQAQDPLDREDEAA